MGKSNLEVEIKLKSEGLENDRNKLLGLGFHTVVSRSFEHDILFDTSDGQLKKKGCIIRLRNTEGKYVLTFKRPPEPSMDSTEYKVKEEIESEVLDFNNTQTIIQGLGFDIYFIYEKYREVLQNDKESVTVTLDHTPIGDFIEIEADSEEIDRLAAQLGFSKKDYNTDSYLSLFREKHKTGHMVFDQGENK